ncbi:MAG: MogA/MoaB family molybdenum cofactor biosynthesis protein [Anaerolineales bacterium]|nr:MAG: MogA/MoaB family molybdenum cofactor biosynthesis protein [Anaerolineales bacterium]
MSINFAILTVSDRSSAGTREDISGPAIRDAVINAGWNVVKTAIIPDDRQEIQTILVDWSDLKDVQIILTVGGTGFAPRDITPEATLQVIERSAPGLAEAMRAGSLKITPHAMLSRAVAGIRKKTLIINLPGSPKGALENFRIIKPVLPHAVQLLSEGGQTETGHHQGLAV